MELELTKENIDKILSEFAKECESYTSSTSVQKKRKEKSRAIIDRLSKIDLEFKKPKIIEIINGTVSDLSDLEIPESAIRYKDRGYYHYSYYYDSKADEKFFTRKDVMDKNPDCYITEKRQSIAHFHYDSELDVLLGIRIAVVGHTKETPAHFEPDKNNFLIFTREKNLYSISISDWRPCEVSTSPYNFPHSNIEDTYAHNGLLREFTKMFAQPIMNIGANKFVTMDCVEALIAVSGYKAKLEVKSGPKQKKIDELTAINLKAAETYKITGYSNDTAPFAKTRVEKVKENTCVVRWMLYGKNSPVQCDGLRIYIEGKDIYPCKLNNNGEFIRTTISTIKPENFLSSNMCKVNKEDLKGTLLEYYGEIINDIPEEYKSILLISFIKEPKLEQLFKMGLSQVIFAALRKQEYDILSFVCQVLNANKSDIDEKNVYKFLGVNKYQFNKFKELLAKPNTKKSEYVINVLRYVKTIFSNEISSLDNKTFDSIFDKLAKKCQETTYYWRDEVWDYVSLVNEFLRKIKSTENDNLYKAAIKMLPKTLELDYSILRTYRDYISMVANMNEFRNFRIGFDDKEDIVQMHNAASAVYNLKRLEYQKNAFISQLTKVEKLVYENKDDDFCVVIPKEPGDLAKEGLELHHCVKNYIDTVARGATNIVFIRKKTDRDKPFFTVEVSNDKTIEQVHGFGNRRANTEPGLEAFVKRWAANKRLKINDYNKVR